MRREVEGRLLDLGCFEVEADEEVCRVLAREDDAGARVSLSLLSSMTSESSDRFIPASM